jgi:hypothetical protein
MPSAVGSLRLESASTTTVQHPYNPSAISQTSHPDGWRRKWPEVCSQFAYSGAYFGELHDTGLAAGEIPAPPEHEIATPGW